MDFVDQSQIDAGFPALPDDALKHDALAHSVLMSVARLPSGSVIAIQASWGRGKTDLLARVAKRANADSRPETILKGPLWLNPWQYGKADLLTPLVIRLLESIPPDRRSDKRALRKTVSTLVQAGAAIGLNAVGLSGATGPATQALKWLLDALELQRDPEEQDKPEPDPVAKMADAFDDLVGCLVKARKGADDDKVLICIDDIDRCLPDRQVALLDSLRFLLSTGAQASFIVAVDPTLVESALRTRYGTEGFDAAQYLEKLFALRITLPHTDKQQIKDLIAGYIRGPNGAAIEQLLQGHAVQIAARFAAVLESPRARTPRVLLRMLNRLLLLALAWQDEKPLLTSEEPTLDKHTRLVALWLFLAECWPQVRMGLLQMDNPAAAVYFMQNYYVGDPATAISSIGGQPAKLLAGALPEDKSGELGGVFLAMHTTLEGEYQAFIANFDDAMRRYGL